jgi:DNA-binding MarR family transcriptional regulator
MSVYSNEINQMVNKILEKAVYKKNDEKALLPKNITLLNFFMLKRICLSDNIILTDLKDEVGIDYNTVRKEICNLENSGLIKRIEDSADKRRKFIQVTQLGKDQIKEVNELIEGKLQFVINNFSVNEEKTVLKFLSRINQLTLPHSKK